MSLAQRTKKNKLKKQQKQQERAALTASRKALTLHQQHQQHQLPHHHARHRPVASASDSESLDDMVRDTVLQDIAELELEECLQLSIIASMDLRADDPVPTHLVPFRPPTLVSGPTQSTPSTSTPRTAARKRHQRRSDRVGGAPLLGGSPLLFVPGEVLRPLPSPPAGTVVVEETEDLIIIGDSPDAAAVSDDSQRRRRRQRRRHDAGEATATVVSDDDGSASDADHVLSDGTTASESESEWDRGDRDDEAGDEECGRTVVLVSLRSEKGALPTAISDFVHDASAAALELPPLTKKQRVAVARLCEPFLLRYLTLGHGELRGMRLEKRQFDEIRRPVLRSGGRGRVHREPSAKRIRARDKQHHQQQQPGSQRKSRAAAGAGALTGERAAVAPSAAEAIAVHRQHAAVPSIVLAETHPSNVGWRLLRDMGWQGGGLGVHGQGIPEPVLASFNPGRRGLGADAPSTGS